MTPLDGAVALADGDDLAMRVGEELHLHVPGPLEVALAVERAVAERAFRLPRGRRERLLELVRATGRRASRARRRPRPP